MRRNKYTRGKISACATRHTGSRTAEQMGSEREESQIFRWDRLRNKVTDERKTWTRMRGLQKSDCEKKILKWGGRGRAKEERWPRKRRKINLGETARKLRKKKGKNNQVYKMIIIMIEGTWTSYLYYFICLSFRNTSNIFRNVLNKLLIYREMNNGKQVARWTIH